MKRLVSSMSGNQKGFTLIELLVVIAILGVIAAVVALNVSTFFGRGTVQAANTELHQVQTAIISLMADTESPSIIVPAVDGYWAGGNTSAPWGWRLVNGVNTTFYASDYVYGPFRAAYRILADGTIESAILTHLTIGNPWTGISWNATTKNWQANP